MLRRVLAATRLRLEEKPVPELGDPNYDAYWTYRISSVDFHRAVRIRDGAGIVFQECYTGGVGTLAAKEYVRVDACTQILGEGIEGCTWTIERKRPTNPIW